MLRAAGEQLSGRNSWDYVAFLKIIYFNRAFENMLLHGICAEPVSAELLFWRYG